MDINGNNTSKAPPPSYDETIRNRKISTATIVFQQRTYLTQNERKCFEEQYTDSNQKVESDTKVTKDDVNAPRDPLYFVLITIVLLGLVHQLPHSFFGIANEYWMYKLRNTTLNTTNANERTYLQINFSSLSGVINSIPTVICNFLLTFVAHNVKAKTRVMSTLILHTVVFCVEVIFVNVNTDSWQEGFFIVTMTTMVLVMCSISFGAAGQYGLIPKLPPIYMKVFLLGGGISNLFNSGMRLLSVAVSPSPIVSANIYFGTVTFLILTTTIMTFIAMNKSFFRYYTNKVEEVKQKKVRTANDFKEVLKCIWPMILLNVILIAFPFGSISNLVVSEHHEDESNIWARQYFVTVCSYLLPSFTNTGGRAIYNKLDLDWSMSAMFILVIMYQMVNTSTIFLSNALPRHHLPVIFKHDWEYALVMGIHGFAMGFITSMTTMKSIRMVPPEKTELAMLLLYFFNSVISAAFSPMGMIAVRLI